MKVLRMMVLTLILVVMLPLLAQAKAMFTTASTEVYKKNSKASAILTQLEKGVQVNAVAVKGKWVKVKVNGFAGFVQKATLTAKKPAVVETQPAPEVNDEPSTMYATAKIKLYASNKSSATVRATLAKGSKVTVHAIANEWAKVTSGKKNGFVKASKLTLKAPSKTEQPQTPAPAPSEYQALKPGDTGEAVKQLQTRLKALGWFYGDIGGNYKTLTTQAVRDFQGAAKLSETGVANIATLETVYASNAPKNTIESTAKPASGSAVEMDWWTSGIQQIFPRGATAVVTDVETGLSYRVGRYGGTNHADVQPLTAEDTAVMKKIYGGVWSWNRRAVWVSVGGKRYAASINGMPHGSGSITNNNFPGHSCIHFTNSRTHGSNVIDAQHQAAIKRAVV